MKTQRKNSRHRVAMEQRGFTLIEGIIAVGIIGSALIVGLALAYSNMTAAQANSDRVLAGHLAREGIEVMRWVRDTNWMRQQANIDKDTSAQAPGTQLYNWDDFFDGWPVFDASTKENYLDVILDNNFTPPFYSLKAVPGGEEDGLLGCVASPNEAKQCRMRKNAEGVYYQDPVATGEGTPFYRRIFLQPVCHDTTSGGSRLFVDNTTLDVSCPADPNVTKVGVLVTSHVVWQRGGKTLEVKIKERLYDWR